MATGAYVIDEALRRLAQEVADPIFWSRAELLTYLNDGFLEFTLYAAQLTSEAQYAVIGSNIQGVPLTAIAIIHISFSSGEMMEKVSIEMLDRENPKWQNLSGNYARWAPAGLTRWIIDQVPTGAANVSITTLDQPDVLTEDSVIDLAPEYVEGLIDYVFHTARFKEGGAEFAQAATNYDSFLNKAGVQQDKTYVLQFVLWSRDPLAKTGASYQTS